MAVLTLTNAGRALIAGSTPQNPVNYTQLTLGSGSDSGDHALRTALVTPIATAVYPIDAPATLKYAYEAQQGTSSRQFVAVDFSPDNYAAINEVGLWAGNTLTHYGDYDRTESKGSDQPLNVIVDVSWEASANAAVTFSTQAVGAGSVSRAGIWQGATAAETAAGTALNRVVTPDGLFDAATIAALAAAVGSGSVQVRAITSTAAADQRFTLPEGARNVVAYLKGGDGGAGGETQYRIDTITGIHRAYGEEGGDGRVLVQSFGNLFPGTSFTLRIGGGGGNGGNGTAAAQGSNISGTAGAAGAAGANGGLRGQSGNNVFSGPADEAGQGGGGGSGGDTWIRQGGGQRRYARGGKGGNGGRYIGAAISTQGSENEGGATERTTRGNDGFALLFAF